MSRLLAAFVLGLMAWATQAYAAADYGTPAAQAALQFDPFNPSNAVDMSDTFLQANPPVLVSGAGTVQPPAAAAAALTPIDPTRPILDVVDSPKVFEGPYLSGLKASFVVTLQKASNTTVTVKYRTLNGTARAGIEYKAKSGTLTFAPGRISQIVLVDVLNDNAAIGNTTNQPYPRTFFLEIFTPTGGASIGRSKGTAEIVENQKSAVGITVSNALPVSEVGSSLKATFTVSLNKSSSQTVKVNYATANGTATAGSDYTAAAGTLTFSPGQTVKTVVVTIKDNSNPPEDIVETFFLNLSAPQNAILLRTQATGQIVEFMGTITSPTISISPAAQSVVEGNSGTKSVSFTVSLNAPSTFTVKVSYATANAGATAGSDYNAASGLLTFLPGQTSKSISVLVKGDTAVEPNEVFNVNLTSPVNGTIGTGSAKVTITNND